MWLIVFYPLENKAVFSQEPLIIMRQDTLPHIFFSDTSVLSSKNNINERKDYSQSKTGQWMVFRGDTLLRSPWGAVGRSFLIPGWGQWYNDRPWKALIFITTDLSALYFYRERNKTVRSIEKQRRIIDRQIRYDPYLSDEQKRILVQRFRNLTTRLDGALNRRNIYGWLFALSHLLCMTDAYVDAHLYGFDEKMDMAWIPTDQGGFLVFRCFLR